MPATRRIADKLQLKPRLRGSWADVQVARALRRYNAKAPTRTRAHISLFPDDNYRLTVIYLQAVLKADIQVVRQSARAVLLPAADTMARLRLGLGPYISLYPDASDNVGKLWFKVKQL